MYMEVVKNKMNKQIHQHRQQLQTAKASYHRVSPKKVNEINSHTSQKDILKVCERKRTKKYSLLIQLAMLGFIVWGGLLLVSYMIDNQNGGKQVNSERQNLYNISTHPNMLILSDLYILQTIKPTSDPFMQANNASKLKEFTQQLQQIRMHNILRSSNWGNPIATNEEIATITDFQRLSAIYGKQENYKKNLVETWEKDFLSIKN